GALVHGGQESVAVVARAAIAERGAQRDEAGQVFVFGAETIRHPRAHGRADERGGAGVQEERGGTVGDALRVHGADEREVVRMLAHLREKIRGPEPTLAVLGEIPEWLEDALLRAF